MLTVQLILFVQSAFWPLQALKPLTSSIRGNLPMLAAKTI
jgi:hypothetical protein